MALGLGLGLGLSNPVVGGITRSSAISDIIPSCVLDLDATLIGSYDGSSQNWVNQGTDGSALDFFLGDTGSVSADDPTFTGSADSPAAYLLYDGANRNGLQGANTTFINSMHRTDNTSGAYSLAMTFFMPADFTTGEMYLAGTTNASSKSGVRFVYDRTNQRFEFTQTDGTSSQTTNIGSNLIPRPGQWNLIVFTVAKSSGTAGTLTVTMNNRTKLSTALTAFGATTTDATEKLQISGVAGSSQLPNGSRVAGVSMFNTALSDAEYLTLEEHYELRHERDYLLDPTVQSIIPSACFDFDATLLDSYAGSGTDLLNLVATPADGVAQTGYEFNINTGITFTNNAGNPDAFFQTNGSGFFNLKVITDTIMAKMHRTDQAGAWLAYALQSEATPAGADRMAGNSTVVTERGTRLQMAADEKFDMFATNGTTNSTLASNVGLATANLNILMVFTWDGTTGTLNSRAYFNTATKTEISVALQTDTTDITDTWELFRIDSNGMSSGWRLRGFYGGNGYIDDADVALLFPFVSNRHLTAYPS